MTTVWPRYPPLAQTNIQPINAKMRIAADEGLNADLKQHITRKAPLRSKQALKQAASSHMHRLSKSPARVRSFFHQKSMRYAA